MTAGSWEGFGRRMRDSNGVYLYIGCTVQSNQSRAIKGDGQLYTTRLT